MAPAMRLNELTADEVQRAMASAKFPKEEIPAALLNAGYKPRR
jgi:hypothetical protein